MPRKSVKSMTNNYTNLTRYTLFRSEIYREIDSMIAEMGGDVNAVINPRKPELVSLYYQQDHKRADYVDICNAKGVDPEDDLLVMTADKFMRACTLLGISIDKYAVDITEYFLGRKLRTQQMTLEVLTKDDPILEELREIKRLLEEIRREMNGVEY